MRRILAATAVACAAAAAPADAAQPHAGTYAGATTQPTTMPYTGKVKLATVREGDRYRIAKVTARMKLDCQGDPPGIETYTVTLPLPEGAVSGSGRFAYSVQTTPTSGFSIKGRFVTRTRARGSLGYSDA